MKSLLFAFWFFAPAGLANAAPVFASKLPYLRLVAYPMDFGKSFRGQRVFGDHKTWRGLVAGILLGTAGIAVQKYLYINYGWAQDISRQVNYGAASIWLLGPLFGVGTLMGDAIESFFKRQLIVPPGHSWFPFDQTDYILGGLFASIVVIRLQLSQYLMIIVTWFGIHLIASYLAYLVKLKEKPI